MRKNIIVFLLLISILLTGCWDKIEIEERAHISAVSVDKYDPTSNKESDETSDKGLAGTQEANNNGNNQLQFTFAFPKESMEDIEDIIISTVGDNLYSVSRILANRTNKEIFLGHLRTVILGSDVVKDQDLFREVLDGIETNELLSRRVILAITDDKASDIINISPTMQPRVGQFIAELFRRRDRTSRAPGGSVGDILKDLHESGNTVIPRIMAGKTDVKVAGAAVISNYELAGWLGEIETSNLMILKGEAKVVGGLSVNHRGHSVPVDMRPQKPKIKLVENDNNIKIVIEIQAEADIKQTYFEADEDLLDVEIIEEVEDLIDSEVEKNMQDTISKIQKEFRADIIGIDRFLRQRHYRLWKQVEDDWREIFPNIDIEVNMDVKIRRVGLVR